jgi:2-oxo-4-hydroxy-4-carboxy-5-ureidoimidazoline decarboxylase
MVAAQMNLQELNTADNESARQELTRCCGSRRWVEKMIAQRPFKSKEELFEAADDIWQRLEKEDWLEAFSHHPKIGDVDSLRQKFATTKQWAEGEQKGVQAASEATLSALAEGNAAYEQKFGYIFIVCATGKSADEMLALLRERLDNPADAEIAVSMLEQDKITRIRLEKLLS